MHDILQNLMTYFIDLGYTWIFILMALESSIFPVPSEAVMIPAWYFAKTWDFNLYLVILSGTFWSLLWAIANYFILWRLIGKPFLIKYWKYILITEKKYQKAESLFLKNDKLYTFIWRLLPVIRHLISIPAWIFKMNFFYFCTITTLWAFLWCSILAFVGYYMGQWILDTFHKYSSEANIIVFILLIISIIYFIRKKEWK